jgi:hypothetical protein
MNANLLDRRCVCLELRAKGLSLSYIVSHEDERWNISKRPVYRDWHNRGTGLKGLLDIKDKEFLFLDILADHKMLMREAARAPRNITMLISMSGAEY